MHQGAFFRHPGKINWLIPIDAFPMEKEQMEILVKAGQLVDRLLSAVDRTMEHSESMKRFLGFPAVPQEMELYLAQRQQSPSYFRLDMTPDLEGSLKILEIQLVAGGVGITEALANAYGRDPQMGGISQAYEESVLCLWREFFGCIDGKPIHNTRPLIAVVGSKDSPYRFEHLLLARHLRQIQMAVVPLAAMRCEEGGLLLPDGRAPVGIHRLFRSPSAWRHTPKRSSLILGLIKAREVFLVNVWKDYLEDKRILALVHHPEASGIISNQLSGEELDTLRRLIPKSWVLDSRMLKDLHGLSRGTRTYYLKKARSFGSKELYDGQQLSARQWESACRRAAAEGDWILQEAVRGRPSIIRYLDPSSLKVKEMRGYLRVSPYYFRLSDGQMHLADVLVTARPQRSRVHGASDSALVVGRLHP
jgi:hypothetical protein